MKITICVKLTTVKVDPNALKGLPLTFVACYSKGQLDWKLDPCHGGSEIFGRRVVYPRNIQDFACMDSLWNNCFNYMLGHVCHNISCSIAMSVCRIEISEKHDYRAQFERYLMERHPLWI